LALPDGFDNAPIDNTIRKLTPISNYFMTYLKASSYLIKYTNAEANSEQVQFALGIARDQAKDNGNERAIKIIDADEIFVSGTPRMIYPSDLATALLAKSFDKVGCFSAPFIDLPERHLFGRRSGRCESVGHDTSDSFR
jgi:hypothetical protein